MITLQEAINIAREHNPKYNAYQEYSDAYEFYIDDGVLREGGADMSCIVEKASGNLLRWAEYFMDVDKEIVKIGNPIKI